MLTALQLPFQWDPERLRADLDLVLRDNWSPHFNSRDYSGKWRGIALRSTSGSAAELRAHADGFADTPLLQRCSYFQEVMAVFQCPLKSVRLLGLAPGSFIREHTDNALDYEDGEVRIHVPVQTNAEVEFYLCGERLLLEEGGAYYVNVNLPHRVNNRGATERIHLVIDAKVNDWIHDLFRQSQPILRIGIPHSIDEFRLAAHTRWRERLQPIADRSDFIAAAGELDPDLTEGDIDAALRSPGKAHPAPLRQLTPVRAWVHDGQPWAEWIDMANRKFGDPFFEETIRAALLSPFSSLCRWEAPLEPPAGDAPIPSGFIFHMSRCGSTLVTRMLGALPHHLALSEPPPLDQILRANPSIEWIRWIVAALAQAHATAGTRYFVKLDAWQIHNLPAIRAAFPRTPWIFLFRDPVEVLASQARGPGMHALPGAIDPRILGLRPEDITLPRNEWTAKVLAEMLRAALAQEGGLFVPYRDLPGAMFESIAPHFGLSLREEEIRLMADISRYDAKSPGQLFPSDVAEEKVDAASLAAAAQAYHLPSLHERITLAAAVRR